MAGCDAVGWVIWPSPVSRRISRWPKKVFGLAAVDFANASRRPKKNAAEPPVLPPTYWDLAVTTVTWMV